MTDRDFGAEVVGGPDDTRLHMRGDLDSRADETLGDAYHAVAATGSRRVTLDFGDVGYINSTGIALVVRLLADARRDGRGVRAVGLTPHYQEIFRITRLSDFMEIVEGDAA
ncbi:MAG TPA: STAS domain-containing protein [Candidatus Limnocylindrales bacterium]|nr:STAS domain-containing protein [Candidatus Limnocylindrales bacterium]